MASLFPGGGEPLSKYDRFMTRFEKVKLASKKEQGL